MSDCTCACHTNYSGSDNGCPTCQGTKDNQIAPRAGDRDQPYTFGRADKALKSGLSGWSVARLLVLRGRIQDRRIDRHVPTPDPDGL